METKNILIKYANQDINLAKKQGHLAVCETKVGNVEITFNGQSFDIRNFNSGEIISLNMTKKQAVEKLSTLYVVA